MKPNFCDSCESKIDMDLDFYQEGKDGLLCEHCYDEAMRRSVTANVWCPEDGESYKYLWPTDIGKAFNEYHEEIYTEDDINRMPVIGCEWISSSAWRGYYDPKYNDNWMVIETGWMTGRWDDVEHKHLSNDFVEDIISGKANCPVAFAVVCSLTSNIFSQATDFLIKKNKEKEFVDWLENNYGVKREQLNRSLS